MKPPNLDMRLTKHGLAVEATQEPLTFCGHPQRGTDGAFYCVLPAGHAKRHAYGIVIEGCYGVARPPVRMQVGVRNG